MARRKSGQLEPLADKAAAISALETYAGMDATLQTIRADRDAAVAKIDAHYDQTREPLVAEQQLLYDRLQLFHSANPKMLTGSNRSAVVAGVRIGMRQTPKKVVHRGMKVAAAVKKLIDAGWKETLIRTTNALDKPALLKILDSDHAAQIRTLGFDTQQSDEFFLETDTAGKAKDEKGGTD